MAAAPLRLTALPATDEHFALGEGPRWDAARDRLLWVDIARGLVLEGVLDGLVVTVTARHEVASTAGAVAFGTDGSMLVAAHQGLVHVAAGRTVTSPALLSSTTRFNDGAVDPSGRFLVGTLALERGSSTERLMRLEPEGALTLLDDDLGLSNGLGWSADGSRFFSTDTLRHVVYARDYDAATGAVGPREEWLRVEDGYPDGIAVDAEDHVWVAVWGAGEARRYSPHGELVAVVTVPAPHTSAVALAGPQLDVLVITTATEELDAQQLASSPASGRLFSTRVDVPGLPATPWRPCPLPSSLPSSDPTTLGEHP
jgi:sugar lactone lactonase YvrE